MIERYRESGKFGQGAVLGVLGLAVGAALVAWVYQAIVDWIPLIYVNVLVTSGFGVGIGMVLARVLRAGKNRSRVFLVASAVGVALVADFASFKWAYDRTSAEVHDAIRSELEGAALPRRTNRVRERAARENRMPELDEEEDVPTAAEPTVELVSLDEFRRQWGFDDWLSFRTETGWSVGSLGSSGSGRPTLSGVLVYLVWLVEAGILVVLAVRTATAAHGDPYCETCDRWTEAKGVGPWHRLDAAGVRRATASGALEEAMRPVPSARSNAGGGAVVSVCPDCGDGGWVKLFALHPVVDKKGKQSSRREVLLDHARVTSAQRDAFLVYEYPDVPADDEGAASPRSRRPRG